MPPPVLTAPPGGDVNRGPSLLAILWATTGLAGLFVLSRLYVRLVIIKWHGWDDYLIIASIILGIIGTVMDSVAVHNGLGRHSFYLDIDQITNATKFNYLAIPFNLLSSSVAKTSICFFLLHVNQNKKSARFLYAMMTIMLTLTAAACILLFAQCKPVYALWTQSLFLTNCLPPIINAHFGLAQSIFMVIADVTFAFFPLTFLWKLKMTRRTKAALAFVLSLGGVAAAFGIVRCIELNELGTRVDILYSTIDLAIWSFLEQNVTIMAACCPVLYKVFSTCLGARGTKVTGYSNTPWRKDTYANGSKAKKSTIGKKYAYGTGTTLAMNDDEEFNGKNYIPLHDTKYTSKTWERPLSRGAEGDIEAKAGSEDGILRDIQVGKNGDQAILKTTEVSVRSERSESIFEAYRESETVKQQTRLMFQ